MFVSLQLGVPPNDYMLGRGRAEVKRHANVPDASSQYPLGLWYALHVLVGLRSNAVLHGCHASEEDYVDNRHGHLRKTRHIDHIQTDS